MAIDELVLLLVNNTGKSVVFRNLTFEPLSERFETIEHNEDISFDNKLIAIPVISAIILFIYIVIEVNQMNKLRKINRSKRSPLYKYNFQLE